MTIEQRTIPAPGAPTYAMFVYRCYRESGIPRDRARMLTLAKARGA